MKNLPPYLFSSLHFALRRSYVRCCFLLLTASCYCLLPALSPAQPGSLNFAFNLGTGASLTVLATAIQSDGKIIIGGEFTTYNGTSRNLIARLNADGTLDTSFDPGTGAEGGTFPSVYSISIQSDGKIIIGGSFTSYNGTGRNYIARINADGTLDTSFDPGTGANNPVNATAIQSDGKIIIGGQFITYNGSGRNRIARLNADGTLDTSFDPGTGVSSLVWTTAIQSDGKIIIGGEFTTYNGTGRNYIARLNADGTLDTSFDPGTGASFFVYTTAIQSDGKIIIGGAFTTYNGTGRNKIARINTDGTLDPSFDPGTGASNNVEATSIQSDGKIIIGGAFTAYNGTGRNYIARLWANIITTAKSPTSVTNDCTAGGTISWTSTGFAFASDNQNAVATFGSNNTISCRLKTSGYGFAIPAGDIIDEVAVLVECASTNTLIDSAVYLVKNGTVGGTNAASGSALPGTEAINGYGAGNLWNLNLTPADINAANFGAVFSARRAATGPSRDANVDHIQIKVYHHTPVLMTYNSSAVAQVTTLVNPNTLNAQIIRIAVNVSGDIAINASSFTFNMTGTTALADIENAKLFYTGTSAVFTTSTQLGSTLAAPTYTPFAISGFSQNLLNGTNYFWLAVDVKPTATLTNAVDAECTSLIVDGISRTPSPTAPAGSRTITAPATYTVCPTGCDYTSIQNAYNAVPSPLTNTYFIELQATYTDVNEPAAGIVFAAKTMSGFFITVRPAAGVTGKTVDFDPGTGGIVWKLDGAKNITIDGRPGGTGTSRELTVRNTRTAASVFSTFYFNNDAVNNTLTYLNVEGEADANNNGIIRFDLTTGTTGNDNNTVSFCYIRDLTVGGSVNRPNIGVFSKGTAGKENSNGLIDSCHFIDIFSPNSINSSGSVLFSTGTENWTVTNNHFYQTTDYSNCILESAFIYNINNPGGHTIKGNTMGGTAPGAGGTPLNITTGTAPFYGIYFDASTGSGNNVIKNNTIANISYTTTMTTVAYPFAGITLQGTGNYTCGSLANGNTIGSMSSTGNITVTNNAASGSLGFVGIYQNSSGTVNIGYNNIGGITVGGTRINASCDLIGFGSAAGIVTIQNNTLGGTIANSISVLSDSPLSGIWNGSNTNGMTVTDNTIQNFKHSAVSTHTSVNGIANLSGSFTCTGNTIKLFNTPSTNSHYGIRHQGTTATISSNIIQDITLTSVGLNATLYGIYMNTAGAVTCNSNTIGSSVNNNISIAGDAPSYGIYKTGAGTLTCNNDTIQQINMTATGASSIFRGVNCTGTGQLNASGNTIRDIDLLSTNTAYTLVGIYCGSSDLNNTITKNTIRGLNALTTTATAVAVTGILAETGEAIISKNFIYELTNLSTYNFALISGITAGTGGSEFVRLHNNVILINNGINTNDIKIYGIQLNVPFGESNVYQNTVKIYGNVTAGTAVSAACFRNGAGIDSLKNNIFQNLRTGGTGGHYAEYATSGGTFKTNFNFLEVADNQNKVGNLAGTDYTFTGWKTATGATNDLNGATTLDANGYAPSGFIGANAGTDLFTGGTVTDDKNDNARDINPWMGAYEGALTTITTSAITPTTLCAGAAVSVSYTITGTYNPANVFTAQLSDAAGSFAAPVNIGTLVSQIAGTISAELASSAPAGAGYRIRVISSNPAVTGSDNGANLSISICSRYWVNGAGNWNDTGNWSATSGGVSGASAPHKGVYVYLDANSFTGPGQIVTLPAGVWYMKSFIPSGVGQQAVIIGQGQMVVGQ